MSSISKFIKDQVLLGNNKYKVELFENSITEAQTQLEDNDLFTKQAKKHKKTDFSKNRKAKRGELQ